MPHPAGVPLRDDPQGDEPMIAVVLSGVRQAGGNRSTQWAFVDEIQRTLRLRGEKETAAVVPSALEVLLARQKVETREIPEGEQWRLAGVAGA